MMPCYNAARTLPIALASLVAQTYPHWECVIVDDGSTDRPVEIVNAINDPRVRFARFEENRGRGSARQHALDLAQGDYLCMLDADDWYYPWKLERQIEVMKAQPDIAVVSTGMAITNEENDLVGIRILGANSTSVEVLNALKQPGHPPLAFAPAMFRTELAKQYRFDLGFRLAEDKDFLLAVLLHHSFATSAEITYVYSEFDSINIDKIVQSLMNNRLIFRKYQKDYRNAVYRLYISSLVKDFLYRLGFRVGMGKRLIANRSQAPSKAQMIDFLKAKSTVLDSGKTAFVDTPYAHYFSHQIA